MKEDPPGKHKAGKIKDTRKVWVNLPKFDLIFFQGCDNLNRQEIKDVQYNEDTPPAKVEMRIPGRRTPTMISLTHMTEAELNVFEKFWQRVIEAARPTVVELDRRAQEAYENGDDGFERLYRPLPTYVDRERGFTEHGTGVQSRLERTLVKQPKPSRSDDSGVDGSQSSDGTEGDVQPEHDQ